MSITRCLSRIEKAGIGLPGDEKQILLATIERYKADGMEPGAAAIAAVRDALGDARSERAEIEAQIDKQLPKAEAKAPEAKGEALTPLKKSGDFYVTDGADAERIAKGLGVTLTTKNGSAHVGIPAYNADAYRAELEALGYALPEAEKPAANAQPVTMQNRDRSRAASVMQMQGIANSPDAARLSFSRDAGTGAPMVYAAGDQNAIPESDKGKTDTVTMQSGRKINVQYAIVEADGVQASNSADGTANADYSQPLKPGALRALNNGRTAGIQAAHNRGKAGEYVKGISEDAALHGVSAEAIASKKRPMLVRIYSEKENSGDMGAESNQSAAQGLSPVEQARTDARALPDLAGLVVSEDGNLLSTGNAAFLRGWFKSLGSDAATLMDSDGLPNKKAGDRLASAIFHFAYQDDALTEAVAEDASTEIKNILHALTIAAPIFAKVNKDGALGDFTETMSKAVQMFRAAKANGQAIEAYIAQIDMFAQRDESAEQFATYLAEKIRTPRRIGEQLREIARLITDEQNSAASIDMFGRDPLTKAAIMRLLKKHSEDTNEQQPKQSGSLFGSNPKRLESVGAATNERGSSENSVRANEGQSEPAGRGRTASVVAAAPDVAANADAETGYEFGDLVKYTNDPAPPGMRSFVYLEGNKKGKSGVSPTREQRDANVENNKQAWQDQQEQAKRLAIKTSPIADAEVPAFPMAEAESSYNGISYSGGRRAKQDADDYEKNIRQEVEAAEPFAISDKQRTVMADAEKRLRIDYLSQYKRVMVVRSGAYSAFVAGRSGLNTKQSASRNAALDRAQEVFSTWLKQNTGRIKTVVLNARSPEQLADEKNKADEKAKAKEAEKAAFIVKLLNFKNGDDLRFGTDAVVERVNKDRKGYPSSVTIKNADGTSLESWQRNIDLVRVIYKNDKAAFMKAVDDARAAEVAAAPDAEASAKATQIDALPVAKKPAVVAPAPETRTPIVDRHIVVMDAVRAGTASLEDYRSSFAAVESNEEAIKAELAKKTKEELLKSGGAAFFYRHKGDTKPEIIRVFYNDLINEYALGKSYTQGGFVMMTVAGIAEREKSKRKTLVALVEAQTAEDLAEFAKEVAETRAEFKLKREARAEAIANPKTLDDFRAILREHVGAGKTRKEALLMMTPEQRVKYDELEAEGTRSEREERKKALKPAIKTAGQKVDAQIIATKHTQKGHDLFVVRMAERVSREDYETLNSSAKQMGGNYSSFRGNGAVPGFQFRDSPTAEAFVKLVNGDASDAQGLVEQRRDAFEDDRGQSVVERLRAMADKLTENAEEIENADRKTNTSRRARFAGAALRVAAENKAKAQTMRNIASAIEGGTAKFLDEVRTKTQVDMLSDLVKTAKNNELRAKYQSYADQEKRAGEPPTAETADYSEFPSFTAYRSDIASLGRQLLEVEGTKKLGQQIMKVADDVTDAYLDFAKANILKVRTFSNVSDASVATFPTADIADKAIKRSGYKGKAIAMQIKRGQYTVILSPSEAINRGIWKGDGDKRITFKAEFGKELVDAIGRRGNKQNRLTVPWQFQNAYDRLKLLSRIGIETASEYRSALREFIALKKEAVADKVKEMELAMVGRKADGLDFFPTPAEIADQMVEAAELTPDMAVLEPSAGMGHLADRIRAAGAEPDVIEVSADRRELLQEKGYHLAEVNDFMNMEPRKFYTYGDVFRAPDGTEGVMQGYAGNRVALLQVKEDGSLDQRRGQYYNREELVGIGHRGSWSGYDRIIMNPPFSNRRDAEHVRHAYELLKPGGRIVAIMGEGVFFGSDKKAVEFRQWFDEVGGTDEKLPPGSFLDPSLPVNTAVNARMVVIEKPLQTKFSKAEKVDKPSAGMDRTALLEAIAPIIDKWNASIAPEVTVVQSSKDLPQTVRDARGFDGSVEAAISGNRIYLVADRFSSVARAQEVLAHEAVGHYGMEAILGKDGFAQVAAQVITLRESGALKDLFAEIDSRYGKLDDLTFASEAIAVMAEKGVKNTVMGRVMAAVRKFLRDLGFDLQLSETDLRAMIAEAARFLQKGDARAPKNAVAQFSKSDDSQDMGTVAYAEEIPFDAAMWADLTANLRKESPEEAKKQWEEKGTDSEFFKRWFGESKAVTKSGKPIKLYHGTSGNFFAFTRADGTSSGQTASGLGIFTTTQRDAAELYGDRVIDLYAKIEKPYRMGEKESMSFADVNESVARREVLQRLGYDGVYMTHMDAWVAFDPKQLKSATANRGTFASSNPDIRFSKMPPIITNAVAQGDAWLKGFLNAKRKDTVIYNLQDRFIDLKRQIEKIANTGAVIQESENPTLAEDAYAHSRGYRIKQFAETERNPILQKLHDLKIPLKKFEQFLHARHAESRNRVMAWRNPSEAIIAANLSAAKQSLANLRAANAKTKAINQAIREVKKWRTAQPFKGTEAERLSLSGMSDLKATNFMASLTPQESAGLAPLGVAVDKINNDTLDLMVEYGLETQDTVDALKAQWEHYIPLHRDEAHPEDGFGLPIGSGFSVSGSGLQQATGSNAAVTNIMAHISEAREQMITRGEKNKVSVAIANFIKAHPDPSFAEVGKAESSQKLDDGLVKSFRDPIFMQKSRDNVLMMRVNGKDIPIVFNDKSPENLRLAMALKNLDGSDLDKVESIIGKGTRYFSAINTQYNPIFGIFNLMRDVQGMALNLTSTPLNGKQGSVMKLMPSAMKAIFDVVRGRSGDPALAKLYREFNLDGGTTGFSQMFTSIEERTGSIEGELKAMNSKPIQAWRKFKNALDGFNTIMEDSTRFSIYMAALDAGLSREIASSLAKNTTVNFNRKGAYTTKIGAFYSFFNASVQGNARMIQTFAGPAGLKIIAAGVAMGAITALMGIGFMDDDEWEKIPEFVRERSLIFPTGKTSYLAWPLPLGFNLLPNIGRKFVESVFGSKQVSPQRRLLQLAGSVVGTFNPLGGGDIGSTITPTIADPMISLFRNQDWTGKPIYREDLNSLKPTPGFTRTKDTATPVAKWIAEKANSLTGGTDAQQGLWSPTPDQLDYVMGQITGGVGREVNKTLQIADAAIKGEETPFYKIPLLGKFWGTNEGAAAEAQSFYQNVKIMNLHGAEVSSMRERGRSDEVIDYLKGNPEARLVKMSEGIYRDVARLRKVINMLKKGNGPQARIQAVNDAITQKMKLFNDRVSESR